MSRRRGTSLRDIITQAAKAVIGRPVRSALTTGGIGLGVAATVATLGVAASANAAISDRFDALKATLVTVEYPPEIPRPAVGSETRARKLAGVKNLGYLCVAEGDQAISKLAPPHQQPIGDRLTLIAAQPAALSTLGVKIHTGRSFDDGHGARGESVALLDDVAAKALGIGDPTAQPIIHLNGKATAVLGIFTAPAGESNLTGAVVVPYESCLSPNDRATFGRTTAVIRTALGAADQVGRQAPAALAPLDPDALTVGIPPDLRHFRQGVESDTRALFLGLAAVSLTIGALGVSNTTLVSVLERRSEIGLRRAIGASRKTIASQFLVESALLGAAGGVLGTIIGIDVTAGIALLRDWLIVVEPWVVAAGPAGGLVIGMLAGLYPAWSASRIAPATALRS
ncbi:MAG TPA: ABC transporter permease [Micromonosporaceae bacterium]